MGCCDTVAVVVFNLLLFLCTLPAYLVAKIGWISLKIWPWRSPSLRRRSVLWVTCLCWRFLFALCCWIRIEVDGLQEYRRELGSSGRACVILSNHLSFLDTIMLVPFTSVSK